MVSVKKFRKLALSFDEAEELPHFEKKSFRINKKIFATLDESKKIVVVKLPALTQRVFCNFEKEAIYPVPGKWGQYGWTMIELKKIATVILADVIRISYRIVAPSKLAKKYPAEISARIRGNKDELFKRFIKVPTSRLVFL